MKNKMNLRSLKLIGIGVTLFLALLVGLNKLVDVTTPIKSITDPVTGEKVEIVAGKSIWQPLEHLVSVGGMAFIATGALVVAFLVVVIFCEHTAGKHAKSDDFDFGWESMTSKERTRWSLGIIIGLACALIIGFGSARAAETSLPVSIEGYQLILKYEVSSRAYYEKRLQRPTVPAWRTTASGVTIGFGYDLSLIHI